jgi:asparagine synthetase B (glutamine-hydrolysing)
MYEQLPEPILPIRLIRSTEEILRWNYPGLTSVSQVQDQLIKPNPVDPETRQRNRTGGSLFDAIVASIEEKLSDLPCFVELSGGCDSSLVLSAATAACRRADHAPPESVTFRFPEVPEMDESAYQEAVLDFLGLKPGHIFRITDEFDLLGPSAQAGLRMFGPTCPAPIFSHVDLLRTLGPGLLLSGEGGDEVLGPRRIGGLNRAGSAIRRHNFRATAGHLLDTLGPLSARKKRYQHRQDWSTIDWIEPAEVARFKKENSMWGVAEPLRPARYPVHYQRSQTAQFAHHQLTEIRRFTGQQFFGPLMDPSPHGKRGIAK